MGEELKIFFLDLLYDLVALDSEIILLAMLIVSATIVLDAVSLYARRKRRSVGITGGATTVSIDGSKSLPLRTYVSEMQGLAGKPDALISESGFIIPIERKPLARKIRDRYVAQLLVYMRLVEEFEGKKPPYGYLILGPNCRRVKIYNTQERQKWLQKMLDEMVSILHGAEARPDPHPRKCPKCSVRESCAHAINGAREPANIPAHAVGAIKKRSATG